MKPFRTLAVLSFALLVAPAAKADDNYTIGAFTNFGTISSSSASSDVGTEYNVGTGNGNQTEALVSNSSPWQDIQARANTVRAVTGQSNGYSGYNYYSPSASNYSYGNSPYGNSTGYGNYSYNTGILSPDTTHGAGSAAIGQGSNYYLNSGNSSVSGASTYGFQYGGYTVQNNLNQYRALMASNTQLTGYNFLGDPAYYNGGAYQNYRGYDNFAGSAYSAGPYYLSGYNLGYYQ